MSGVPGAARRAADTLSGMTKKATAGAQAQVSGVLGIDIGGSGIKGAPVDLRTGTLLAERVRIPTPEGARPEDVTAVVAELAGVFPDTSGRSG